MVKLEGTPKEVIEAFNKIAKDLGMDGVDVPAEPSFIPPSTTVSGATGMTGTYFNAGVTGTYMPLTAEEKTIPINPDLKLVLEDIKKEYYENEKK